MTELTVSEHDFNPDRLPWEKQQGESVKAFSAFALYRNQGVARSLTRTAQAVHETGTRTGTVAAVRKHLGEWSVKWRWVERCDLYHQYLDKRDRDRRETARDALLDEISQAGQALRTVGLIRLLGPQNSNVNPLDPHEMDAADVARFLELGSRLGLRALGEPTDYLKNAFMIAPARVTVLIRLVAEVALTYIDEGSHARFLRDAAEATGCSRLPG